MSHNLAKLENILSEELRLFSHILELEEQKSKAIVQKDGSLMQKLSSEQEEYLNRINPIEELRVNITASYAGQDEEEVSLREIVSIEGQKNSSLVKTGEELKKTINRIKTVQYTNTKMMNDNMELFNRMVNMLKGHVSDDTGYGKNGMEKSRKAHPVLLDKKI